MRVIIEGQLDINHGHGDVFFFNFSFSFMVFVGPIGSVLDLCILEASSRVVSRRSNSGKWWRSRLQKKKYYFCIWIFDLNLFWDKTVLNDEKCVTKWTKSFSSLIFHIRNFWRMMRTRLHNTHCTKTPFFVKKKYSFAFNKYSQSVAFGDYLRGLRR